MTKHHAAATFAGLPLAARKATIQPIEGATEESREFDVVLSAGATVRRYRWEGWDTRVAYDETLLVTEASVNMTRVDEGAVPLLDSHSTWGGITSSLGKVLRTWIEDGKLWGRVKLHDAGVSEAADALVGMIRGGTAPALSVGYTSDEIEVVTSDRAGEIEQVTVRRWTLYELSAVDIPADMQAGFRSNETRVFPVIINRATPPISKESAMKDIANNNPAGDPPVVQQRGNEPPAEHAWKRSEITSISECAKLFNLDARAADEVMADASITTLTAARDALQARAAKIADAAPKQQSKVQITRDEGDTRREAVQNAIMNRATSNRIPLTEAAREYRGMKMIDLGRSYIEDTQGVRLRNLSQMEMASVLLGLDTRAGMHSTSDFPLLLANVISKSLRDYYRSSDQYWRLFSAQSNFADYKEKWSVGLSGIPELLEVKEGAEYKYATFGENREKWGMLKYGRIVAFTRESLINDDLGVFDNIPRKFGRAAAERENELVWAILTGSHVMGDGVELFHADHDNLAVAAADVTEAAVAAAEAAMGEQLDAAGKPMNLKAKYLVVSPNRSLAAKKLLSNVTAGKSGDVNIYTNAFNLIVDQSVRAAGGNPWFLVADPAVWDTIEFGYLDGEEGLQTEQRVGFEVDGLEVKGRLDFGCKAIDYRGFYKNAGN